MQEIGIREKWEKVGNQKREGNPKKQKSRNRRKSDKVGYWKMQEIRIRQKWEKVDNQKMKDIQ